MRVRPVGDPDDRAAVDELLRLVERADGYPPLTEDSHIDYAAGPPLPGFVAEDGGSVVGYAHLRSAGEAVVVEAAVPPARRAAIIRHLLAAALEAARPSPVLLWASDPETTGAATSLGLRELRALHHLAVGLPPAGRPALPAGVALAEFRPGRDDPEFLELNAAAFAGHPDNASWGPAELAARVGRGWFDPGGFFLARRAGRLVGACWTKRHGGGVGEIYWIGVHPDEQGAGLGRALLLTGLVHLSDECHTGILYTESGNRPARRLYEALGFRSVRVKRLLAG